MKLKINFLIGFAIAVLVVLTAMQYYLVKTTYHYKVAQFQLEVKEKIGAITDDYTAIDSSIFYEKDILYKRLAQEYFKNPKMKLLLKNRLLKNDFKSELTARLKKQLEREFPEDSIDFALVANKFIIYENAQKSDTVFAEKPLIGNKLFGNLASLDNAFLVRNYVGTASNLVPDTNYKLLTEDTLYVSVNNWQQIILKRMAMVLFLSVTAMFILVVLFVMAIKALIRQKKVNDVKTDFINNITHELKTPLTTLSVSTKILEQKGVKENDAVFNTVLDTINRQNTRLQHLIDQVMTNSLGYEEIALQKVKTNSNVFLKAIIDDFKIAYPDVVIVHELPVSGYFLEVDPFHLTTAINNVLDNAVKYGCKNIRVSTVVKDKLLKIEIQDDGIGVAKEKQTLLFDKFYRVEQGNIHTTKGLGLGLYYVDQIIKAHKGAVKIDSELGKGTLFHISIPAI